MKFLSPEFYLYESTMQPCIEYCFCIYAGVPIYYLNMLDEQQKRVFRTRGLPLAASLEPLLHLRNVASVSLFYKH